MIGETAAQGALIGLRERKKARTRETIARVALELFDKQGYHSTTIAMIAEAADVSPRTVSAYYPAKEEMAFPWQEETFAELERRLRDRPLDETAPEALRGWVDAQVATWRAREEVMALQQRVLEANEELRNYKGRYVAQAHQLMAREIARDLDASPDDIESRMAAAATVAIVEVLHECRDDASVDGDIEQRHAAAMAMLDRAVLFVSGGIRALRAKPRPATP